MEDKYKKTMLQLQQYLSNRGGDEQTDDGSSPKHMGVYISGNIMVAIVCPNQGTEQKLQDLVSGLLEMTALDMGPPGTTLAGVQAGISMFKEGNVYKIAFKQGYIAEAVYCTKLKALQKDLAEHHSVPSRDPAMKLIQVDKEKGGITLQAARDGIEHDVCGMVSLSELVESNDDTMMDDGGNMATWCLRMTMWKCVGS